MEIFSYLFIILFTISAPLLLSWDKKVYFRQYWPAWIKSVSIVGFFFIIWDIIFASQGFWGFNERYHLPFKIFHLPLEEIGFFITVPYACSFIYKTMKAYLTLHFHQVYRFLWVLMLLICLGFLIENIGKWYSTITFFYSIILLGVLFARPSGHQPYIFWSYLISLLPFILVNGYLTGMFTPEPIVWYNNEENMGRRFITIPYEDFSYSFNLIVSVILGMEFFNRNALSSAKD